MGQAMPAVVPRAFVERRRSPFMLEVLVRLLREKPLGLVGLICVLLVLLTAALADLIAPYGYNALDPILLSSPSAQHILGTDQFGRDIFSRVVYGSRVAVYAGFGTVAFSITLATIIGVLCGYFGGWLDHALQRIVDAGMAVPGLIMALLIIALFGAGLWQVIVAMGIPYTLRQSRVIRSSVLSVRENQYIEAAQAVGCSHLNIMGKYVLPNILAPIIILATMEVGSAIMLEASLGFLGLGIPPPFPSWGRMLAGDARKYFYSAPWMAIWPGVALSVTIFGWSMLGDALRDLLDPRLRGTGRARFR